MKEGTPGLSPALALSRSRVADYVELAKPRVAVLVLFTVAAGAWLAGREAVSALTVVNVLVGTAFVAAGASALNQLLERHSDGLMRRTENRPLPSGRLQPFEVLVFGAGLGAGGLAYLGLTVHQPLAVVVAAITFLSYVFLYTPLKRKTTLNTLIGAIPGALPPVIGWTAVRGSLSPEVGVLFLILFLWQVPHFLAIAWIYREDYARAGLCMLPTVDPRGAITGRQMISYCLALVFVSLAPALYLGQAGTVYLVGAALLGFGFLLSCLAFARVRSSTEARLVMRASLVYLPMLLGLLLVDQLVSPLSVAFKP
jgi:protoheme IX farnesyltransferase